ncbi:TIGR00153 family protein [Archaeoglobus sulfaticallidus PM70-1]|uniref:TIGR00153 family protein n=1 Tax=Archaeoglobus sulfaticallidus PM70-1 TaxID=387631 RepID=N0BFL9_9EURY|nr:TIGR00153 family protein [Archaeoglobus sulfaticallidus]AGK61052.1 TIGR00153 family protein [Archaeoglobus sulfaticallidus PM70-1]
MFRDIKKFLVGGEKEEEIINLFKEHIEKLSEASETLKLAIESDDASLNYEICELERTGDIIRRDIALGLYEGAFLPGVRGNLYRLAELLDECLDLIEDTSVYFSLLNGLHPAIRDLCLRIAEINCKMVDYLYEAFNSLYQDSDLSDKTIKIRAKEQEIDGLKRQIHEKMFDIEIKSFWEGSILLKFLDSLISISDKIEDSADLIQVLNVSMR